MTEELTYRRAITAAIGDALEADDRVVLFGEDVAAAGGAFKLTDGLFGRFGAERVRDTPISEQAIVGTAIGAAIDGLRPVAEIMFADFGAVCFDGLVNELPKLRYMSGGQVTVPVVIRMANGGGVGFGAQHSQTAENWFLNVPGLKLALPATPADAYGLLRAAIQDPDPVLVFEHKALFGIKGPVPREVVPFGRAETVRPGEHATVVATQLMRHRAVAAAERLVADGIEAEVIDPRTLVPFDLETIAASVLRTGRLVVAQEAPRGGSWGETLVARIAEDHLEMLDAPPRLVHADATPIPYAEPLETAWLPSAERIADAVRASVAYV